MTSVSVIVPCYNAASYLAEALASVAAQTRVPDEVIVVDDGSTDGSADLAERLGADVLRMPRNSGAAAARNAAAHRARGDVLAFLDADDLWLPRHLDLVIGLLERHPETLVAHSSAELFGDRTGTWEMLLPDGVPADAFWASLDRVVVLPSTSAVSKDAFLGVGGFDETLRLCEDYELWLRLARLGPFVGTHEVTCRWRQHDASTSYDRMRYWEGEYQVRAQLLAAAETAWPSGQVARLRRAVRDVWLEHLATAWHARKPADLRFHLGMRHLVPGTAPHVSRWERRVRLMPLLPLWDALPRGLRRRPSWL